MRTRTRVGLAAVVVLVIGAVATPLVLARVSPATTTRYLTETVRRTDVTKTVAATGRVVDARTYAVVPGSDPTLLERNGSKVGTATPARGYTTTDLRVGVGETVEKGDVLAVVEDDAGERTKVKAPFDGVVRSVLTTRRSAAGEVATLAVGGRRAVLDISEYDVARVAGGQSTGIELNGTGQTFRGSVRTVAPTATTSSGVQVYATVVASSEWPKSARVGMTVTGTVTVQRERDVLAVPSTAVAKTGGGHTVSVLDAAGQPQTRVVRLGLVGDRWTAVRQGVKAGERVVTGTDGTVTTQERRGFVPPAPGGGATTS